MFNKLKLLLIPMLAFSVLSACVSMNEIATLKKGEAVSILKLNINIDGKQDNAFSNQCYASYKDENDNFLANLRDKKSGYNIIKSKPGKVYLSRVSCISYRVFYSKHRNYKIDNLYFVAKEGHINYLGDLEVKWMSENFKSLDVLDNLPFVSAVSIPFSRQDKGTLLIKTIDRNNYAKNYVNSNIRGVNLPWNITEFSKHNLLNK